MLERVQIPMAKKTKKNPAQPAQTVEPRRDSDSDEPDVNGEAWTAEDVVQSEGSSPELHW